MQHIDPVSLDHLPTRIAYLRDFIGFTKADVDALHAAAPVVGPLVPTVVDTVYEKLLGFDITAKAFVPRQTGYTGVAPARLEDLSMDHPQIRFRKDFLAEYCKKLVTMDYEKESTWEYLNKVGLMHTGVAGFKHREKKPGLRVEYIHCGILLGYVEDILVNAVATHPDLDLSTKTAVIRAVNKVYLSPPLFLPLLTHCIPKALVDSKRSIRAPLHHRQPAMDRPERRDFVDTCACRGWGFGIGIGAGEVDRS
ncbi:hypothetical protein C0995_000373 [Termitomyces sp. Mi166|nr:hypothetical protein C0995_000373 [Termitomyces sp. Mi166\